jgi:hypothetical protein
VAAAAHLAVGALGTYQDRPGVGDSTGGRSNSDPPRRPQTRHQHRVRGRLCLRRMPQSSEGQDGETAGLARLAEHRPRHQQPVLREIR